jgi:hypothetical protein
MATDKTNEAPPQETMNFDLLYRLYDFILSPEWDALGEKEDEPRPKAAEIPAAQKQRQLQPTR